MVKFLTDVLQDVEMTIQRYFRTSKEFYDTALSYLEAWNKVKWGFIVVEDKVPTEWNFENATDLLSSEFEVLTVNPDELSDEFILRGNLSQKRNFITCTLLQV
jgi:hypothetical protein